MTNKNRLEPTFQGLPLELRDMVVGYLETPPMPHLKLTSSDDMGNRLDEPSNLENDSE